MAPMEGTRPMLELVAILDELEEAGLLESFVREDGKVARRITEQELVRTPAMAGESEADVVLDGLLDVARAGPKPRARQHDPDQQDPRSAEPGAVSR